MSGSAVPTEQHESDADRGVFVARAAPLGPPTDAQRELILAHVVDPTILDEREPFVWQATVSNSNLDSYYTRMHESSLRNFVEDALAGLSFMNSHRTGGSFKNAELPLGHSFDARYIGPSGAGPARVDESFFTLRGLAPNGTGSLTTDQFIDGLRSGIARDVSIGFIPGSYRCSIDGLDWLTSRECRHWPGMTYPKLDSKGNDTGETQTAYLWVHDAHQSEVSSVFDGATPGCMVTKARRMAAAGEMRADTIDLLEQRYRINLPHPARVHAVAEIPAPAREATPMEFTAEQIAAMRLALTRAGQVPDADIPTALAIVADMAARVPGLETDIARIAPLEARVAELEPLAETGRQYRADLVEAAITEGKRARGADFDEAVYRSLLEAAPIETVKRMRDDWTADAAKLFPGGRQTQDPTEPTPIRQAAVPSAAYAG